MRCTWRTRPNDDSVWQEQRERELRLWLSHTQTADSVTAQRETIVQTKGNENKANTSDSVENECGEGIWSIVSASNVRASVTRIAILKIHKYHRARARVHSLWPEHKHTKLQTTNKHSFLSFCCRLSAVCWRLLHLTNLHLFFVSLSLSRQMHSLNYDFKYGNNAYLEWPWSSCRAYFWISMKINIQKDEEAEKEEKILAKVDVQQVQVHFVVSLRVWVWHRERERECEADKNHIFKGAFLGAEHKFSCAAHATHKNIVFDTFFAHGFVRHVCHPASFCFAEMEHYSIGMHSLHVHHIQTHYHSNRCAWEIYTRQTEINKPRGAEKMKLWNAACTLCKWMERHDTFQPSSTFFLNVDLYKFQNYFPFFSSFSLSLHSVGAHEQGAGAGGAQKRYFTIMDLFRNKKSWKAMCTGVSYAGLFHVDFCLLFDIASSTAAAHSIAISSVLFAAHCTTHSHTRNAHSIDGTEFCGIRENGRSSMKTGRKWRKWLPRKEAVCRFGRCRAVEQSSS